MSRVVGYVILEALGALIGVAALRYALTWLTGEPAGWFPPLALYVFTRNLQLASRLYRGEAIRTPVIVGYLFSYALAYAVVSALIYVTAATVRYLGAS